MKTIKTPAAVVATALTLMLTGCGKDAPESSSNPQNTTVTQVSTVAAPPPQSTTSPPQSTTSPPKSTAPPNSATSTTRNSPARPPLGEQDPDDAVASFQAYMVSLMMDNPKPGTMMDIGPYRSTVCNFGDGFGVNLVNAGPHTSCEFANALFDAQTAGLNAMDDNVRDHLKPHIEVKSPVTGETYRMECNTAQTKLVVCSGGNNATVLMY